MILVSRTNEHGLYLGEGEVGRDNIIFMSKVTNPREDKSLLSEVRSM